MLIMLVIIEMWKTNMFWWRRWLHAENCLKNYLLLYCLIKSTERLSDAPDG